MTLSIYHLCSWTRFPCKLFHFGIELVAPRLKICIVFFQLARWSLSILRCSLPGAHSICGSLWNTPALIFLRDAGTLIIHHTRCPMSKFILSLFNNFIFCSSLFSFFFLSSSSACAHISLHNLLSFLKNKAIGKIERNAVVAADTHTEHTRSIQIIGPLMTFNWLQAIINFHIDGGPPGIKLYLKLSFVYFSPISEWRKITLFRSHW